MEYIEPPARDWRVAAMFVLSGRLGRPLAVAGAVVGMVFAGASGASAWTFATKSAPQSAIYNGVAFGHGAGSIYRNGFTDVFTDAQLKDPVSNGRGVYQQTNVSNSASGPGQSQTGRRSGSTWAAMERQKIYSYKGWVGAYGSSKVCEDASLRPDICSTTKTSKL